MAKQQEEGNQAQTHRYKLRGPPTRLKEHRTIKERVRAIVSVLPYKRYLPRIIAKMVYNFMLWLNAFAHKDGVHITISSRTLITGLAIDYHEHCKLGWRIYLPNHFKEPDFDVCKATYSICPTLMVPLEHTVVCWKRNPKGSFVNKIIIFDSPFSFKF